MKMRNFDEFYQMKIKNHSIPYPIGRRSDFEFPDLKEIPHYKKWIYDQMRILNRSRLRIYEKNSRIHRNSPGFPSEFLSQSDRELIKEYSNMMKGIWEYHLKFYFKRNFFYQWKDGIPIILGKKYYEIDQG